MDLLQSPNRVGRINVPNNVTDAQAVAAAGIQLGSITREQRCPQIEKADGSDKRDLSQFLVMDQCQICWVETTSKTTLTDAELSSNFLRFACPQWPAPDFPLVLPRHSDVAQVESQARAIVDKQ